MNRTHPGLATENAVSIVSQPAHQDHFKLLNIRCHTPQPSLRDNNYGCDAALGLFLTSTSLYLNVHFSEILKYDSVICSHRRAREAQ